MIRKNVTSQRADKVSTHNVWAGGEGGKRRTTSHSWETRGEKAQLMFPHWGTFEMNNDPISSFTSCHDDSQVFQTPPPYVPCYKSRAVVASLRLQWSWNSFLLHCQRLISISRTAPSLPADWLWHIKRFLLLWNKLTLKEKKEAGNKCRPVLTIDSYLVHLTQTGWTCSGSTVNFSLMAEINNWFVTFLFFFLVCLLMINIKWCFATFGLRAGCQRW